MLSCIYNCIKHCICNCTCRRCAHKSKTQLWLHTFVIYGTQLDEFGKIINSTDGIVITIWCLFHSHEINSNLWHDLDWDRDWMHQCSCFLYCNVLFHLAFVTRVNKISDFPTDVRPVELRTDCTGSLVDANMATRVACRHHFTINCNSMYLVYKLVLSVSFCYNLYPFSWNYSMICFCIDDSPWFSLIFCICDHLMLDVHWFNNSYINCCIDHTVDHIMPSSGK